MITGFVQGQVLRLSAPVVAADTLDYLTAQFVFRSADWNGMEKWAHFAKGGTVYDIPLTEDKIRREDHLNLGAGEWKVYIHGNRFADDKVVERITTAEDVLCVVPTGALNGEPFPEMPASVTEQILARLDDVEQNGGGSGGGVQVDDTLSKAGYAADAAAVGDALTNLSNAIDNTARFIAQTVFNVGENVLTTDRIGTATNWTSNDGVYTHASGSAEALIINTSDLTTAGDEWLITFDSPDISGDVLYVSFGEEAKTQTYNGRSSIAVALRVKADGDNLLLTPKSTFSGTLTNLQVRKITTDGTEYAFDSDSVTNLDLNAKTGFWNVILGTEHTFTKAVNSNRTIAIGHNALHSIISGNRNIGIGTFALQQLLDGEDNLAIGADAMGYLDSAMRCTAFGVKSLVGYTGGITDSVAIGACAGLKGNQLTAIGSNAGSANTGDDNVFIGAYAGSNNTSGSRNIIIGSYTHGQPTGNFNIALGRSATYPNGATNCIAIGKQATCTKSNQAVIGSPEITESRVFGDLVVQGTDGVERKITFNEDGTCSWVPISNLITYPFAEKSKTVNGITFTDNGDGTITANGTATSIADFTLKTNLLIPKNAKIMEMDGSTVTTYEIQAFKDSATNITTAADGMGNTASTEFVAEIVRIRIRTGYTANNLVFNPRIYA